MTRASRGGRLSEGGETPSRMRRSGLDTRSVSHSSVAIMTPVSSSIAVREPTGIGTVDFLADFRPGAGSSRSRTHRRRTTATSGTTRPGPIRSAGSTRHPLSLKMRIRVQTPSAPGPGFDADGAAPGSGSDGCAGSRVEGGMSRIGSCRQIPIGHRPPGTRARAAGSGRTIRGIRRPGRIRQQDPCWVWARLEIGRPLLDRPGSGIVRARADFIDERDRPGRQCHGVDAEPRGPRVGEHGCVANLSAPDARLSRQRSDNLGRVAVRGRRGVSRDRPPLFPRGRPGDQPTRSAGVDVICCMLPLSTS
jgi:hypothetical protein